MVVMRRSGVSADTVRVAIRLLSTVMRAATDRVRYTSIQWKPPGTQTPKLPLASSFTIILANARLAGTLAGSSGHKEPTLSLFDELKRRNVFRVTVAYIIVAWLLLQVSDTLVPALHLPGWFLSGVAFLLILGFPVAIVLAWAFELTPEGLKREKDVDRSQSITHKTGRKFDFAIIAVLTVAVAYLVGKVWFAEDPGPPDTVSAADKSIAVLPFDNRSANAEDAEFFAAGVHDELLTLLSKLGGLRVISRTSVEHLDRNLSIPEIGALLNVATVLQGQVQRAEDRLHINVQLISTMEEDYLWANTYDRQLTAKTIFEVQSDIARMIADALRAQLSRNDEALLDAVPTESTQALNHYLIGRQLLNRNGFEPLRRAEGYFEKAIELDPHYAEAWATLARTRSYMLSIGMIDAQEYIATADHPVTKALQLDDRLPDAHVQLANLRWRSGNFEAAEMSFKTALELDPGDSRSLEDYGEYLRVTGRPLEAIAILKRVLEDDPLSIKTLNELGKSEMYAGRPEQNVLYCERILEIDPSSVIGYIGLLQANVWMAKYDLALPWGIRALTADPEDFELWSHLGLYAELVGADELADRAMDRALALGPTEPTVLKVRAMVLSMRGKNDEALLIARRALDANLDDRWFSSRVFLRVVRDGALRTGDFDDALGRYRDRYPELFHDIPKITVDNVKAAADLALLLRRSGDPGLADILIDAGLSWYQETQIRVVHGFVTTTADIEFLALKADKKAAIDALQAAADEGWGQAWRWNTSNENFASLRKEPAFQAIIAQLEEKMATQLVAIRALPNMGEFDLRFIQSN